MKNVEKIEFCGWNWGMKKKIGWLAKSYSGFRKSEHKLENVVDLDRNCRCCRCLAGQQIICGRAKEEVHGCNLLRVPNIKSCWCTLDFVVNALLNNPYYIFMYACDCEWCIISACQWLCINTLLNGEQNRSLFCRLLRRRWTNALIHKRSICVSEWYKNRPFISINSLESFHIHTDKQREKYAHSTDGSIFIIIPGHMVINCSVYLRHRISRFV